MSEFACVAQADGAGGGDFVVADSPDCVVGFDDGECFVGGVVGRIGSLPVEGSVGALGVVDDCEALELGVEVIEGVGWAVGAEPSFQYLVAAFDLALGSEFVRAAGFLRDSTRLFLDVETRTNLLIHHRAASYFSECDGWACPTLTPSSRMRCM